MRRSLSLSVLGAALLLCGCAAQRITGPARTIGNEVATFQGALSGFQDALKTMQDDSRATISGSAARATAAVAVTLQLEMEWAVARANSESEILTILQAQGKMESTRLLVPATQPALPAPVAFPIDTLGAVAKTLDQLSQGPTARADLEFLSAYGKSVMTQLKALEEQAKAAAAKTEKKSAAPTGEKK